MFENDPFEFFKLNFNSHARKITKSRQKNIVVHAVVTMDTSCTLFEIDDADKIKLRNDVRNISRLAHIWYSQYRNRLLKTYLGRTSGTVFLKSKVIQKSK